MKKTRFQELDALRGLAALLVVFFHYTIGRDEANLGFKLGTTGVDLFFIISGFVILLSLKHIEKPGHFIINRISRLYPTYWASVTVTFILVLISSIYTANDTELSLVQYLGNMTMFQFYLKIPNLDGPYWTMIIEMLFYIFMILLFHIKLLKYITKIGGLLTLVIALTLTFFHENSWVQNIFYYIPLLQFWPLFFAGILFHKIMAKDNNLAKLYGIVILCLISQLLLFKYSGRSKNYIEFGDYTFMIILYFTTFTLFVNNKLKFIIHKPLLFFGKISFALYLIHQKISVEFIIPSLCNKLNMNFWAASAIALISSIGLATFITYVIEIPFRKKMRTKLYRTFYKKPQTTI